ncbi:DUF397 domain-containing protein [Streptomyces parvus]|uniref:DUF397 domain-containing protein n=1 Tax=Streptomyces parvus TaxID=66428 RepID=UPI00344B1926
MQEASCPDLTAAVWRSSSHSNQEGGNCVQVADGFPGVVPVRDSKNPTGRAIVVPAAAWSAFIAGVVAG